ncbi:MAG TPA: acyl-CoA dehydrogenase [Candidatus Syntrophoarchaeum butanivorans]|uniref:Acyl-CoA dehydrogenase n=1 Tax=Candidatus Syntropharchaeum butanivorans TaxID=1839936 RepID=A0A7C1B6F2_9EURY|nr:acyl-CoA dehydrogenase [Candidatus Syntrophoarchaeum butanivorans]
MEKFPWWTEEQMKLADEVEEFLEEIRSEAEKAWWRREYPHQIMKKIAEKGYFGVDVPKKYGGMELGLTGACIVTETLSRLPTIGLTFLVSSLGGNHQLHVYGTEEQKERWFPKIAKGQIGAVCITEPFVGSDAAATATTAVKEGDHYILNGKKRFISNAGVADRYMVYARTSDDPADRKKYRHLTGFLVEKGMPGFKLEKINDLIGFDTTPNGVLSLDNVKVSLENMVGKEGDGWMAMMSGLNYERTIGSSMLVGMLKECVRLPVWYMERRVQFGQVTSNFPTNQFKVADIIKNLKLARLMLYHTAHLIDMGKEPATESAVLKCFASDTLLTCATEAIQLMGGDGLTKFYGVEWILRDAKVHQITMGTNEIMKMLIYRAGIRDMKDDLKINSKRVIDEELGVPISSPRSEKRKDFSEETLIEVLCEDYRSNPGLHMSREDIKAEFEVEDEKLDEVLVSLEEKGLVDLYRDRRGGITLAKATYQALLKQHPPEYYSWFPAWYREEDKF